MNNGDVAKILSVGGLAQGVSFIVGMNRVDIMFMMYFGKAENQPNVYVSEPSTLHIAGGLILVPCLGSRLSLALAAGLYSLAPLLTHLLLVHGLHR